MDPSTEQSKSEGAASASASAVKSGAAGFNFEVFLDGISKNDDIRKHLKELKSIYIDARTIGNQFGENAFVHGSVIGGDYRKPTITSAKEVVAQVSIEDLKKISRVYVETSKFCNALQILQQKRLVILYGSTKLGKRASAIRLLTQVNISEILELDPTILDLATFNYAVGKAYIINSLRPTETSGLRVTQHILRHLSDILKQQDSYFIITADPYYLDLSHLQDDYLLTWQDLPDRQMTLARHLEWHMPDAQLADKLLSTSEVQSTLTEISNPSDIDRFAFLLAKVARNELSLSDAIFLLGVHIQQAVESWFHDHRDLRQRVFLITLSVLSGVKYQVVEEESERLIKMLCTMPNSTESSPVESTFDKTRTELLQDTWAQLQQGQENTEWGLSPIEIVSLKNPGYQPAVLAYVWHEYANLRKTLLQWIYQLGIYHRTEVRQRLAVAVGTLSRHDFRTVLDDVVRNWAKSDDSNLWALAALSLSVAAQDNNLAPQVLKLLRHWSRLTDSPSLCWTAVLALGYVSWRFPDASMRDLHTIANSGSDALILGVGTAVTMVFQLGGLQPSRYLMVLITLQSWAEEAKTRKERRVSALVFWCLMQQSRIIPNPGDTEVPTLLWLLLEEQKHHEQAVNPNKRVYQTVTVALLRYVLNMLDTRSLALEEIRYWLDLADADSRWYPVLGSILYRLRVSGSALEKERIDHHLQRWALKDRRNTAAKIWEKLQNI